MKWIVSTLIFFSLLGVAFTELMASETTGSWYRYRDKNGHAVMSNMLPPEYANDGYDIVSPRGNIIKRVAPKRSSEEIEAAKAEAAAKAAEKEAALAEKARQKAQAKQDDILLKSFSTSQDIENSRNSKIEAITILEKITRDHIVQLKKQLNEARATAANYERMGRPIPDNVRHAIAESKRQIAESELFLQTKATEKEKILKKFAQDLARFKFLKAKETKTSTHP